MLKLFTFILLLCSFSGVFANTVDTSIQDELDKNTENITKTSGDFTLKTFSSCLAMNEVMDEYIKDYWKNNQNKWNYRDYGNIDFMADDMVIETLADSPEADISSKSTIGGDDFSTTNTQVKGVDESDIIKTDGKYVYYYNQNKKSVFISDVQDPDNIEIIKEIKIPNNIYSPVLYIDDNRLVIIGGGYINSENYNNSWTNRSSKTFTIVFDTSDINNPELIKMLVSDGDFKKTRKIGDYVYILSNNYFNIPYYDFSSMEDIEFDSSSMVPKSMELTKTDNIADQNTVVNNKKYPFNVSAGNIVDCDEISYSFPDKDTFKEINFSPSYNVISALNINDITQKVESDVIAGNSAEIFMSENNLYITDRQYIQNNFRCAPNMMCIRPIFFGGNHTVVHKLNIDKQDVSYQTSALIEGSPLTQYSMDEHEGNFRIITQKYSPEKNTAVYTLDENLELLGSLDGLGETEDFKSSRFMGDKLFLVTFEQIDPFYVIDMSDDSQPKVLGELKIPGYSTYLHPYDENHIIGIGYDTKQNKWGGTMNNGIKVDLYEIDYDREPAEKIEVDENGDFQENLGDIYVAQKYSTTLGEYGSSSEATYNPRMFMWNANKNMLLLPAKIFLTDPSDIYKKIDFYQGMFALNIDKDTGIKELYRTTHIDFSDLEEKRLSECKKYSTDSTQQCKELLDGTMYCSQENKQYVPTYCYADSSLGEYKARYSYNYVNDYITRSLWIGDTAISVSNNYIMTSNLNSGDKIDMIPMK